MTKNNSGKSSAMTLTPTQIMEEETSKVLNRINRAFCYNLAYMELQKGENADFPYLQQLVNRDLGSTPEDSFSLAD
jgi:hypothetical protein